MELGSHPDLESIPDDLASISDLMGSALKGLSAPLPSPSEGGPFTESHKALRRLLLKQMPADGVSTQTPVIAVALHSHDGVIAERQPLCDTPQGPEAHGSAEVSYTLVCAHKQYL